MNILFKIAGCRRSYFFGLTIILILPNSASATLPDTCSQLKILLDTLGAQLFLCADSTQAQGYFYHPPEITQNGMRAIVKASNGKHKCFYQYNQSQYNVSNPSDDIIESNWTLEANPQTPGSFNDVTPLKTLSSNLDGFSSASNISKLHWFYSTFLSGIKKRLTIQAYPLLTTPAIPNPTLRKITHYPDLNNNVILYSPLKPKSLVFVYKYDCSSEHVSSILSNITVIAQQIRTLYNGHNTPAEKIQLQILANQQMNFIHQAELCGYNIPLS